MATTEPLNASDRIEKAEGVNGVEEGSSASASAVKSEGSSAKPEESSSTSSATKPASPSKDVSPARQDQASGTASTRSTPLNGSAPTPSLSMPHPKKFSHIDINKRFLEKNSAASTTGHAASPSIANKSSSALQKPATPTTVTHSRLVTAKLTTDIQRSSTTGPGWSRPSSASSSAAPTPSVAALGPKALPTPSSSSAAPQLPVAGKVIQPQPRGAVEAAPLSRKDSAGKTAWGATKPAAVVQITPDAASEEFPTAAEAAQAKHVEKKAPAPTDEKKQPQATDEEADAFRGRHLDPNVHHWDDDDNDDSNFLDEVIEFDDGRQYTVQPTQDDAGGKPDEAHNVPVSKEERFADDFDRSWPPSRPAKHPTESPQQPLRSPTVSSQSMHSPQDSSRVLFNERSNRLEPYSSSRFGGPSRDSFPRRGSRSDMATSPVESRNGRDGPVQLLQKPGHGNRDSYFPDDRSRRGSFTPSHDNSRFRDRDGPRRDFPNGFEHGRSRDQFERNGGPSDRTRRMSNVSSSHLSPVDSPREGRQLPPHLSGTHPPPNMWRAPSERSRRLSTASSVSVPPVRQASHSPASTHAPLSPALGDTALVSSPAVDIDEVRKAAMHSAAERARLRRQHEEEEREKERERARRKAAEIEAKLKAAEQAKAVISASESKGSVDSEVVSIIEDAVKSATQSMEPLPAVPEEPSIVPTSGPEASRPPAVRAPSSRGAPRPPRRLSVDGPSPAAEVDSWRSKARPRPPAGHAPEPASTTASAPPPPMGLINHVDHFSLTGNEDLEVVDFHEHGKLIGVHADDSGSVEPVSTTASTDSVSRRLRPVASDFFHDHHEAPPPSVDNTPSSWRRRPSAAQEESRLALVPIQTTESTTTETAVDGQIVSELQTTSMPSYPSSSGHARPPLTIEPGHPHPDHQSDYANPLRSPYRQAPMAALTDTMARIKGAIDGMHHKPEPEPRQKWVPPARRPPQTPTDVVAPHPSHHHHAHAEHDEHIVREVFDVTGYEPPRSPKPAWNHFMVRFPRHSQERAPLSLQQMRTLGSRLYTRLDVISLVPTGDRRREPIWNVNDQLFSKPYFVKGRPQCTVKLPRTRESAEAEGSTSQPVVNLPAKSTGGRAATNGAFGRSRDADGLSNWRKPPASPLRQQTDLLAPPVGGLDTVSRSPPPETPSRTSAEPGKLQGSAEAPVITVPPTKTKAQPNSTENPAVAFYRDSPNNVTGRQTPPVNFVVNSELEDTGAKALDGAVQGSSTQNSSHASFSSLQLSTVNTATPEQPLYRESLSSSKDPIVEMRKGNPAGPITPPSHPGNLPSLTWAAQREAALKESPSRPPDPEHLKAVWSSTSNKPEKPAVNSLRNIADDLNAPLTQNAKMEDIPTPPPHASTSTHASRMSIMHDITRQFQQVPTPSGSSSHAASHTHAPSSQSSNSHPPPSMTSPAQRPPQLPPSASSGMRLPYPGYPSPMMSSPSPTLVYSQAMTPSPIPQQMMASSPYGQPMWVPMPPGSAPGMMRPMGSPYGAQLMPYPPAGTMYAPPPNMQGPGMPASPSVPGRPPANVMGSQGQPSPYPMYAASPVMMHAMPAPAQNYPGPAQPRGPPPPRGAYDPHHAPAGMQPSPSYGAPQSPAYPQMQPNMYVRQGW